MTDNYYSILGIEEVASQDAIQKAYRRLAMKWHPDRHHDKTADDRRKAEEKFKTVKQAYETLSDPTKRRDYDAIWGVPKEEGEDDSMPWWARSARTPEEAFQHAYRAYGRAKPTPVRGEDIHIKVAIEVQTALRGGKVTVKVPIDERCASCHGTGQAATIHLCQKCGGSGHYFTGKKWQYCKSCDSMGHTRDCTACDGTGRIKGSRSLEVTVPPNTLPGRKLRLIGQGSPGSNGGESGDVFCTISVRKEGKTYLKGLDVYTEGRVDCISAMLGGTRNIDVFGQEYSVTIPPGTGAGKSLKLSGLGLRDAQAGKVGDLFIRVIIDIPKGKIAEDRLVHLRRFAGLETEPAPAPAAAQKPARRQTTRHENPGAADSPATPKQSAKAAEEAKRPRPAFAPNVAGYHLRRLAEPEYDSYLAASQVFADYEASVSDWRHQIQSPQKAVEIRTKVKREEDANRLLIDGRAPVILIELLDAFRHENFADKLAVIGNYAFLAYSAAAGVVIEDAGRSGLFGKRIQFIARKPIGESVIMKALQRADSTFIRSPGHVGKFSARNETGFVVDIIGAVASASAAVIPSSLLTDECAEIIEFGIGNLLRPGLVSAVIVSKVGRMERLTAISPLAFAAYKGWMATLRTLPKDKQENSAKLAALAKEIGKGVVANA